MVIDVKEVRFLVVHILGCKDSYEIAMASAGLDLAINSHFLCAFSVFDVEQNHLCGAIDERCDLASDFKDHLRRVRTHAD